MIENREYHYYMVFLLFLIFIHFLHIVRNVYLRIKNTTIFYNNFKFSLNLLLYSNYLEKISTLKF